MAATDVKVTAPFRMLIMQLAWAFYAGDCPPKSAEDLERAKNTKNAKTKANLLQSTAGLGVILLHALCHVTHPLTGLPIEWIDEELLAELLHLHPKLMRQALRYLEQEQLLAREHREETARTRKKAAAADQRAASLMGAPQLMPELVAGQAVEAEPEGKKAAKQTHSYVCIDWPSVVNVATLRLHKARQLLNDHISDRHMIQKYRCPACGRLASSLDAFDLPRDPASGDFLCDWCHEKRGAASLLATVYETGTGEVVGIEEQRERKAQYLKLKAEMDSALRPLTEHLDRVRGLPVPDFGPLADWGAKRSAELQHRQRRAGQGIRRNEDGTLDEAFVDEVQVEVGMEGDAEPAAQEEAAEPKALPPWLAAQHGQAAPASTAAGMPAAGADAAAAADQAAVQRAYQEEFRRRVQAAMAAKVAARGGALDIKSQPEMQALKAEVKAEIKADEGELTPAAKRIKLEAAADVPVKDAEADAGILTKVMPDEPMFDVKLPEPEAAEEDDEWEDV